MSAHWRRVRAWRCAAGDCTAKYGAGTLAESKCFDCKKTRPDAGDFCCSCRPNKHDWMTVICIDCVVTAHPLERKLCEPCNCLYQDGTNGVSGPQ